MFGSRWVITPSWFSGSWRYFCILLCILNIFCFFQVHTISVLYCAHVCMKYSLCISVFLEEISSLSHSIVFHYLCVDRWGRLAILWNSAFRWAYLSFSPLPFASVLFSAMCKVSLDNHFASLHFSFFGMVVVTCLLYNVMSLRPYFFRHSILQIQSLESIHHPYCIIIRDLI